MKVFGNAGRSHERIEKYLDRLYGYAMSLCNDRERAQDLLQTCALKAMSAKKVPADEPAYRAWLFTILRNTFHDELRKDRRQTISLDESDDLSDSEWNRSEGSYVVSVEQELINTLSVRNALRHVGVRYREVVALVDMIGFSYKEAAAILGVPEGTIMSRLSRARKMLLQELSKDRRQVVVPLSVVRHTNNE